MDVDYFWRVKVLIGKPGECWPYRGVIGHNGYGNHTYSLRGKKAQTRAHVLAWKTSKGPVPEGLLVLHSCDNRRCCNPDHLFLGTALDNYDDAIRKGRVDHAARKLTPEEVRQIRELHRVQAMGYKRLADQFGVSRDLVKDLLKGKTYRWVT
jgi:hypothetical protein